MARRLGEQSVAAAPPSSPLSIAANGVRVAVRLTPRAGADRLDGVARVVYGAAVLNAAVTAPPANNRANEALLRLLARQWRLSRRDLAIVNGEKGRTKIVHIAGDPAELMRRLCERIEALPGRDTAGKGA